MIFLLLSGVDAGREAGPSSIAREKTHKKQLLKADLTCEVKLERAHSGCLGTRRRRRTRLPAISGGELDVSFDPPMSEWGNPAGFTSSHRPALQAGVHPGN